MDPRPTVFLDFGVDGENFGRVVIELYSDITPLAAENFRALCTGEKGIGIMGKPLHYKGTHIDSIVPEYGISGGKLRTTRGKVGESIFGHQFKDENFTIKHDRPGIITMLNCGENTNTSQFMICLTANPDKDGHNVAFGQVVRGLDVLKKISYVVPLKGYRPDQSVVIFNCGEIISPPWEASDSSCILVNF